MGAIDYAINNPDCCPSLLVVTDIDDMRLNKAAAIFSPQKAREKNIDLRYLNTKDINAVVKLKETSNGTGYNDVLVMAPVQIVVDQGDAILA